MLSYGSSPKSPPKPLSENGLRQIVAKIVERGFIRESWHSETERAERNISDEDVLFGLERKDWTLEKTDFDDKHNNQEYLIKTVDVEGVELHLKIVVYPEENRLLVITKY